MNNNKILYTELDNFCINIAYEISLFRQDNKFKFIFEFSEETLLPIVEVLESRQKTKVDIENKISLFNGIEVRINKKLKGKAFNLIYEE